MCVYMYTYSGTLFNYKKNKILTFCNKMDGIKYNEKDKYQMNSFPYGMQGSQANQQTIAIEVKPMAQITELWFLVEKREGGGEGPNKAYLYFGGGCCVITQTLKIMKL